MSASNCVWTGMNIFVGTKNWRLTILVGTKIPHESEGVSETQNVVLLVPVSGLH